MIKRWIRKVYNGFVIAFFSNETRKKTCDQWVPEKSFALNQLRMFTASFSEIKYSVSKENLAQSDVEHKWVGAQLFNGAVMAIPNDETRILRFHNDVEYFGNIRAGLFKWTGGCVWRDALYGFPRTSNSFLRVAEDRVEEIPLSFSYEMEHHYGGVCTAIGMVYQPPRNTNHILKTDLQTGSSFKINIVDDKFSISLRYCGSIIHPNGFIYFFPENNNRVIKLDPKTDKWQFIGDRISTMCFDAKIGLDGNIYGYSAYCRGIMKIDVIHNTVQMIHQEIFPGAYGTKYGVDGCLYSVPGDGNCIYKYDVLNDSCEVIFDLQDHAKAKYAGGATKQNGEIVCIPAKEGSLLMLKPDCEVIIPDCLHKSFFADNY